ncbi:hypothetical protein [Desulfofundulus thermosubterraneus]|uniref:Uncharacterized protein n=1 Tax=Desulfofundulus thermosubterraneus DSM 16057 TaxID=1121432 RepID=A0A1M6KMB6_9FIRM|nr:hypothetical protein [Desulfofundulus thermosubterraneus]SHJ59984.1 hypothetical protein SAMN02745219_02919 [Desulfofundulus thermosubterraneus DSM 16057]
MGLEKYEARIVRGHIMQILKVAYPGPASVELLEVTLNDRSCPTSPAVLNGYLAYLAEKGYITRWEEKDDILGVTRTLVKLTATGVDLLEGNIPADPGVVL